MKAPCSAAGGIDSCRNRSRACPVAQSRAAGDLTDADRADIELRLKLLLAHAKLRGWIVDKKQVARASIDLGGLSPEDIQANLGQYLDALEPGARREIEARVKAQADRARRRAARAPRELAPAVGLADEGSSAEGPGSRGGR